MPRGRTFTEAQVWQHATPEFAEAKIKEVSGLLGELAECDEVVRPRRGLFREWAPQREWDIKDARTTLSDALHVLKKARAKEGS